jgi:hypothetical protein
VDTPAVVVPIEVASAVVGSMLMHSTLEEDLQPGRLSPYLKWMNALLPQAPSLKKHSALCNASFSELDQDEPSFFSALYTAWVVGAFHPHVSVDV